MTERGVLATYSVSLLSVAISPVYLTVSAGIASSTDRNLAGVGAGVLVRVKNGSSAFTNALVLSFDPNQTSQVFEIEVMAIDDTAAEGPRVALISHSLISDDSSFNGVAVADVFVDVVDDDQAGLDIRQLDDNMGDELRITVLHETAHFFGLDDDDLEPLGLG